MHWLRSGGGAQAGGIEERFLASLEPSALLLTQPREYLLPEASTEYPRALGRANTLMNWYQACRGVERPTLNGQGSHGAAIGSEG